MKFKSQLAQEAYEEIKNIGRDLYNETKDVCEKARINPSAEGLVCIQKLYSEIFARAIEVAAKIEIEEYKADTERTIAMWKAEIAKERCLQKVCVHGFGPLSPDWIRYQSEKPKECEHGWASEERCPKCSLFLDEDPE